MPQPEYVIGVDLGGTKMSVAVVDAEGSVLSKLKLPIDKEETVRQISDVAAAVLREAGLAWPQVTGLGVCVPGIYFKDTGNAWAPNLWGWDEAPPIPRHSRSKASHEQTQRLPV